MNLFNNLSGKKGRITGSLRKPLDFLLVLTSLLCSNSLAGLSIVVSGGGLLMPDQATPVPAGSHASVGYFADGFADYSGLYGRDWSDVTAADYIEVLRPEVVSSGSLSGSTGLTGVEGRHLYLWVFDSRSTPELVGEQAFGLFTGGEDWLAKGDGIIPFEQNRLLVDSVTTAAYGSIHDHGIALAPIPEPNAFAILLGVACLGLAMWRRFY